jgi:hypothetical protein
VEQIVRINRNFEKNWRVLKSCIARAHRHLEQEYSGKAAVKEERDYLQFLVDAQSLKAEPQECEFAAFMKTTFNIKDVAAELPVPAVVATEQTKAKTSVAQRAKAHVDKLLDSTWLKITTDKCSICRRKGHSIGLLQKCQRAACSSNRLCCAFLLTRLRQEQ